MYFDGVEIVLICSSTCKGLQNDACENIGIFFKITFEFLKTEGPLKYGYYIFISFNKSMCCVSKKSEFKSNSCTFYESAKKSYL